MGEGHDEHLLPCRPTPFLHLMILFWTGFRVLRRINFVIHLSSQHIGSAAIFTRSTTNGDYFHPELEEGRKWRIK